MVLNWYFICNIQKHLLKPDMSKEDREECFCFLYKIYD